MKIVHRVSLSTTDTIRQELAALGIHIGDGFATFVVDEAHPRWAQIEAFIARYRALDMVSTKATAKELAAADWVVMEPTWHGGYPQPEDEYMECTYDLSDYCRVCGVGGVQCAPFRMRGEPKWGNRSILQLHWVYDEFFARRDVWESVLLPLGITSRPVIHHKSGATLHTIVQCDFGTIADSSLELGEHPYDHCPLCGRRKFLPFTRGCFPRFQSPPAGPPVVKSREYFGSGASAFREIAVSHEMYMAIAKAGLRGCSFLPMCQ